MKRKVIIIEEQYIKVESPSWTSFGHGGGQVIGGEVYFDEPYVNENQKNKLLEEANSIYKKKYSNSWVKEPEVKIYWKILERNEREINKKLVSAGIGVKELTICNISLEDYYLSVTGGVEK